MQIVKAETVQLKVPFSDPGTKTGLFPGAWTAFDFVLLRVETDTGLVGWGEGFSYFCADSVRALIDQSVIPQLIGRDPAEIDTILAELRQKLHIIGRYGITMFAISAADIALHDLNAKAAGVSLAEHLGGAKRGDLPAYASLIRYGDAGLVRQIAGKAADEGYAMIKLHEIELDPIRAAREAIGPDVPLTNDVNCNWSVEQTIEWTPALKEVDLLWLEEPIFPPEDFATHAMLRRETGMRLASGENLCTAHQFGEQIRAGSTDWTQPSVTKIGGIAETMATRRTAIEAGVKIAHHAPYFGPGLLATFQILAAAPEEEYLEYLYVARDAELFPGMPVPKDGRIAVPDGPGLGLDPDPDILARYRV